MSLNESIVEDAALECFGEQTRDARTLTPALSHGEREAYGDVVLVGRLREAIRRLDPAIPSRTLATLRDALLPKLLSGGVERGGGRIQSGDPIASTNTMSGVMMTMIFTTTVAAAHKQ